MILAKIDLLYITEETTVPQPKQYSLNDITHYYVYGRTTLCRDPLPLFWTGSGIELRVKASELWIEFESNYETHEQWISVSINGAFISRQMLHTGKQTVCMFRNMNPEEAKEVRIYKEVQAMSGDDKSMLLIHNVITDGEFLPIQPKSLKIEVIGDSITSGEGSIGAKKEQDWISMFFTACQNYAILLGQKLDADVRIISQSGWGVLSSWDNHPRHTLPSIYDQVCGLCYGERIEALGAQREHDFVSWQPDVIVVNLGTNDGAAFSQPAWKDEVTGESFQQVTLEDGSLDPNCTHRFEVAVQHFLHQLRAHNPNARILWVYGMLSDLMQPYIEHAIACYQEETQDHKIDFLLLPPITEETMGSRFHPGLPSHQDAADRIAERILSYLLSN